MKQRRHTPEQVIRTKRVKELEMENAGVKKLLTEAELDKSAIVVARNIDADGTVAWFERIAAERGAPMYMRFDDGPGFIADAVAD